MCSISILICFEFLHHPFCYHYYIFYFYRNNSTVLCNVFASLICHLKELKIRKWMLLSCTPFLAFFISLFESKFLSGARFLVIFLLPKQLWHVWVCWQWIFWFCLSDSVFISHLFLKYIFTGYAILGWFVFSLSLTGHMAYQILVPQSGVEFGPLAGRVKSPNHWITKELPLSRGF